MLSDPRVRNLKPKEKVYRIADSNGLAIEVAISGSKIWRYRYRYNNKATMISLGKYPLVSLSEARKERDANRLLLMKGVNPKDHKKRLLLIGRTFSDVFDEWHTQNSYNWSTDHARRTKQRANSHLIPHIGNMPIKSIDSEIIISILKRIEKKGILDMLSKVRGIANGVFGYAVGIGIITVNPVRDLPNNIFLRKKKRNYSTITNPRDIGELLRQLESYSGTYQVEKALWLAPHLFLRPGELVGLKWSEVELSDRTIRIGRDRMKMDREHLVPMSTQVYDFFVDIRDNGLVGSEFVFPSSSSKTGHIATESLLGAIRRLGIDKTSFTTHSFRSMASTRLNEMPGVRGDVIEMQLAHKDPNVIRGTYNHASYLEERVEMMQKWSDYLDMLRLE